MKIKCADCGCLPDECKSSASAMACIDCTWKECCCWVVINNTKRVGIKII